MCAIAQCNSYPMIDSPNNLIEVKTKWNPKFNKFDLFIIINLNKYFSCNFKLQEFNNKSL